MKEALEAEHIVLCVPFSFHWRQFSTLGKSETPDGLHGCGYYWSLDLTGNL